jgi:hypothetical protein
VQYLLLIYDQQALWEGFSPEERARYHAEYMELTQSIKASGHYRGGNALQPTMTATTVRARDGAVQLTDGPFAETKEQLGGYYLIEAKDLDEATKIAARIPSARLGSVEVRPVVTFTDEM